MPLDFSFTNTNYQKLKNKMQTFQLLNLFRLRLIVICVFWWLNKFAPPTISPLHKHVEQVHRKKYIEAAA